MDYYGVQRVDSVAAYVAIPLMLLIFAVALLVLAIALVHFLRGIATVNQLKEQIASQYEEHQPERRPSPRTPAPPAPDLGDDEDLELAARLSYPERSRNGEAEVVTQFENARVRDEEPPIPGGGYYARQSDTP